MTGDWRNDGSVGLAGGTRARRTAMGCEGQHVAARWLAWLLVFWVGATVRAEDPLDFAHDVVPILRKHCADCHGGKEAKGGFSMNTRGMMLEAEVVNLESAGASRLLELVRSTDAEQQMPPHDRPRLSAEEITTLERWIAGGLAWETGFTFAESAYEPPLQPRRPELPPPTAGREHPVDRIVDAYWRERQVTPPAPLDDRQFLRRVSLDLVGLVPTPEQLQAFVADASPDKRGKLIDALLADRDNYAAHWLTFWNDLLRNSYAGTGYIDGGRQQVTGWLYAALRGNLPYDAFVRGLVAPSPDAAGFIQGIQWRGNVNASQRREIQFAQSVSQVFLGINMKCASCHDSFIDRWKLEETYALAAVFSQEPLELHRCDKPQGVMAKAAWIFPELGQVDPAAPQSARLRQVAALMTHPQNGRLTRTMVNRLWDRLLGRGIVHPVDAMHTEPWNADLLDFLAVYLADHDYDLKQVLRLIVTSQVYQSQSVPLASGDEPDAYVFAGPIAKRLTAEQYLDAIHQITGTWPAAHDQAFQRDGRNQYGQLRDVVQAVSVGEDLSAWSPQQFRERWGERPLRAVFTDLDPLQAVLGRPIREQVVSARPTDLTSLQAINLANGTEMADLLAAGAARLLARGDTAPSDTAPIDAAPINTVDRLYREALSRDPSDGERQMALEILGTDRSASRVEDLLWIVFMLPEFQLVR
jgi:mono/diheme cytochrome c family protein